MDNSDTNQASMPLNVYNERLTRHRAGLEAADKRDDSVAVVRIGLAVAFAGCLYLRFMGWSGGYLGAAICVAAFVGISFYHNRIGEEISRRRRLVHFYEAGIRRIDGRWRGAGTDGRRFVDDQHPYTSDLDIFGKGSLFELLCTARTLSGENALAEMLRYPSQASHPAPGRGSARDAETMFGRQSAVRELSPRLDLREDISMLGQDVRSRIRPDGLAAWGNRPSLLPPAPYRWLGVAISVLSVAAAIAWLAFGQGYWYFAIAIAAGRIYEKRIAGEIVQIVKSIQSTAGEFDFLALILARLEGEPLESEELKSLKAELVRDGQTASSRIARLATLTAYLDANLNQLFALTISPVLLWTTHCAFAIENWRVQNGADIERWLAVVGQFEAYCALAGYAYEHPERPYATIVSTGEIFVARQLVHPLIDRNAAVPNDIDIDVGKRLYIVSGSNMSGKSTLLRSIGVNAVLAMAGAPVCAQSLVLEPRSIGTSITTQDSLQSGVSRFYAEIKRLGQIVEIASTEPCLFLLDELLHGTNSHDRRIGAEAILRKLSALGAAGLATTHDLAISRIADDPRLAAVNVHFEDQLVDGRMSFDYRLRDGVVEKSNALALMRAVGLDVSDVTDLCPE